MDPNGCNIINITICFLALPCCHCGKCWRCLSNLYIYIPLKRPRWERDESTLASQLGWMPCDNQCLLFVATHLKLCKFSNIPLSRCHSSSPWAPTCNWWCCWWMIEGWGSMCYSLSIPFHSGIVISGIADLDFGDYDCGCCNRKTISRIWPDCSLSSPRDRLMDCFSCMIMLNVHCIWWITQARINHVWQWYWRYRIFI